MVQPVTAIPVQVPGGGNMTHPGLFTVAPPPPSCRLDLRHQPPAMGMDFYRHMPFTALLLQPVNDDGEDNIQEDLGGCL